jgi:hypothetical protein
MPPLFVELDTEHDILDHQGASTWLKDTAFFAGKSIVSSTLCVLEGRTPFCAAVDDSRDGASTPSPEQEAEHSRGHGHWGDWIVPQESDGSQRGPALLNRALVAMATLQEGGGPPPSSCAWFAGCVLLLLLREGLARARARAGSQRAKQD